MGIDFIVSLGDYDQEKGGLLFFFSNGGIDEKKRGFFLLLLFFGFQVEEYSMRCQFKFCYI